MSQRKRPFNFSPTPEWQQALVAIKSSKCTLRLKTKYGPVAFGVKDEHSAQHFRVSLGNPHICSCGIEFCEHLLFCLVKVLHVREDDQLCFQSSLFESEIARIIQAEEDYESKPALRKREPLLKQRRPVSAAAAPSRSRTATKKRNDEKKQATISHQHEKSAQVEEKQKENIECAKHGDMDSKAAPPVVPSEESVITAGDDMKEEEKCQIKEEAILSDNEDEEKDEEVADAKTRNIVENEFVGPDDVILKGHRSDVTSLCWLIDGRMCSSGRDKTLRIWSYNHESSGISSAKHSTLIGATTTSTTSTTTTPTTSCSDDRRERVHCERVLYGHTAVVTAVCVSRISGVLCSSSDDKTVRLWDPVTFICSHVLLGHTDSVNALCILGNDTLCSASSDFCIRIWHITMGHCLHLLKDHTDAVFTVCALPDGAIHNNCDTAATGGGGSYRFCSSSWDDTVRVWDVSLVGPSAGCYSSKVLRRSSNSNNTSNAMVSTVSALPDGQRIFTGTSDGNIHVWGSIYRGAAYRGEEGGGGGGGDGWEYTCLRTIAGDSAYPIKSMCALWNGMICCGCADDTIRIYDVHKQYRCVRRLKGHSDVVTVVCSMPELKSFASASLDTTAIIWLS